MTTCFSAWIKVPWLTAQPLGVVFPQAVACSLTVGLVAKEVVVVAGPGQVSGLGSLVPDYLVDSGSCNCRLY